MEQHSEESTVEKEPLNQKVRDGAYGQMLRQEGEPLVHQFKKDWLFQNFVHNVEKHKESLQMTLIVQGTVVTGELIGHTEFFELAANFGGTEEWRQAMAGYAQQVTTSRQEEDERAEQGQPYIGLLYFHMKNAQVLNGSVPIPVNSKMLFRGKITDVAAWSFGALRWVSSSES
jgi:hypothetical protein